MQLIILLAVMSLLITFTVKCMKREDDIIALEDRIIADIRDFLRGNKNNAEPQKLRKVHCSDDAYPGHAA